MSKARDVIRGHEPHLIIAVLIVLFVVVFFFDRIFVVLEPGHVGVMFRPFFGGTVVDHTYPEGLHILFPWNRMYSYNLRIQETTRTLTALTSDGMSVQLDLSMRYHPDPSMVGLLHAAVGPGYVESIVVPEVLAVVRANVAQRTAEELVTGRSEEPPDATPRSGPLTAPSNVTLAEIVESAGESVSRKYVIVDAVVLVKATLPDRVRTAIEQKIEAKQFALTQSYRLAAARIDTQIKAQEALSNNALQGSITPQLLAWKGIEATKELAASPNSKIIFIGNGANGLPVILGTGTP